MAKLTAKTFKYTHYMTLEEWKQWKENFDNCKEQYLSVKEYFNQYWTKSFCSFIQGSFVWSQTPQQGECWSKIANRRKPINQKKPCKK